jgi:hypothetical protein
MNCMPELLKTRADVRPSETSVELSQKLRLKFEIELAEIKIGLATKSLTDCMCLSTPRLSCLMLNIYLTMFMSYSYRKRRRIRQSFIIFELIFDIYCYLITPWNTYLLLPVLLIRGLEELILN